MAHQSILRLTHNLEGKLVWTKHPWKQAWGKVKTKKVFDETEKNLSLWNNYKPIHYIICPWKIGMSTPENDYFNEYN